MSKPQLAIVSDIFGTSEEDWMQQYESRLAPYFSIHHFDSRELAGITRLDQKDVHTAFVKGGIETAVKKLLSFETQFDTILGFSVGGTIAWKYALKISNTQLYLVSATRLRNEIEKPNCKTEVYFGELEQNGPSEEWFDELSIEPHIMNGLGHECYKRHEVIETVCGMMVSDLQESE